MVIVIIIAVAAVVGFLVYKKLGSKKSAPANTTVKPARTYVKPRPTPKPQTGPGYDDQGRPVKMDNETGPDFMAREAQWYYVHGRS